MSAVETSERVQTAARHAGRKRTETSVPTAALYLLLRYLSDEDFDDGFDAVATAAYDRLWSLVPCSDRDHAGCPGDPKEGPMAGPATTGSFTSYVVTLDDGRYVHVNIEHDGVNEPVVTAGVEDGNEVLAAPVAVNHRITEEG